MRSNEALKFLSAIYVGISLCLAKAIDESSAVAIVGLLEAIADKLAVETEEHGQMLVNQMASLISSLADENNAGAWVTK